MPTIQEVRDYLTDFPWNNFKFEDEFFSDDDIKLSTKWAGERFLAMPPKDNVGIAEVPKYICLTGIIAQLFKRKYISATINYNPGITENGINIPEGEDAGIFEKLHLNFDDQFQREGIAFKQNRNVTKSLTSIRSPYDRSSRKLTRRTHG